MVIRVFFPCLQQDSEEMMLRLEKCMKNNIFKHQIFPVFDSEIQMQAGVVG